jgi:glycosyltransferase involved in cell wall biosynthesis
VLAPRPDVAEMAAAISALFDRNRIAIGAEARARVLRSYSWDAAFGRLAQHYARLAGQAIDVRGSLAHAER